MNKEIRDIRLVFSALSLVAGAAAYRNFPSVLSYLLLFTDFLLWPLILFSPLGLRPLFKVWMRTARVVGHLNTQILLTIGFFFLIAPLGALMRAAGKDPMQRKKKETGSYWQQCRLEGLSDKKRYERQF